LSARDPGARPRFRTRDRFSLAPAGRIAEASYRSVIAAARAFEGRRRAFDDARSAWAAPMELRPDDGVYLVELRAGSATLIEIVEGLNGCGLNRADALGALGRLVDAGLVTPLDH
jgi:hypothetical protein